MLVRLTYTATLAIDLPVSAITWQASATREHGAATVFVPRGSAAWDPAYLSEDGGMLVEIAYGRSGVWRGIADRPTFDMRGASFDCWELTRWLDLRVLTRPRTLYGLPAGAIARVAVRDALAGLGAAAVLLGTFVESPPLIPQAQFNGQTLLSLLTDLAATSGQEFVLDGFGRLNWVPSAGTYREVHIVDDGRLFDAYTAGSLQDVAGEVIEIQPDGSSYTVRANEVPALWPRQVIVRPS